MLLPLLYAILDAACFPVKSDLLAAAEELVSAGVTLIQYRNKSGNPRVMLEQAWELRRLFGPHPLAKDAKAGDIETKNPQVSQNQRDMGHPAKNAKLGWTTQSRAGVPAPHELRLIMNDRADLCLAAEFDGVHVGQEDLSPESVRGIIGAGCWLGVSTHNPEQMLEADRTSADYLAIGPVFATSSKEKPDPVVGLEGVRRARALTRKPLVAIGGITRANAASVLEAGADSVAVISDLLREPGKSAEAFFRVLR
ncbi:MAG TPA: thiamine phosphate synthase [Candidatus Sulfotelmatobacter sp.]